VRQEYGKKIPGRGLQMNGTINQAIHILNARDIYLQHI